MMDSVARG